MECCWPGVCVCNVFNSFVNKLFLSYFILLTQSLGRFDEHSMNERVCTLMGGNTQDCAWRVTECTVIYVR